MIPGGVSSAFIDSVMRARSSTPSGLTRTAFLQEVADAVDALVGDLRDMQQTVLDRQDVVQRAGLGIHAADRDIEEMDFVRAMMMRANVAVS